MMTNSEQEDAGGVPWLGGGTAWRPRGGCEQDTESVQWGGAGPQD